MKLRQLLKSHLGPYRKTAADRRRASSRSDHVRRAHAADDQRRPHRQRRPRGRQRLHLDDGRGDDRRSRIVQIIVRRRRRCGSRARAAMGFGRDIRRDLFHTVTGYSAREVGQFGAPSLITRTTNDVQQIQMLVVMARTMMIAAPHHHGDRHLLRRARRRRAVDRSCSSRSRRPCISSVRSCTAWCPSFQADAVPHRPRQPRCCVSRSPACESCGRSCASPRRSARFARPTTN